MHHAVTRRRGTIPMAPAGANRVRFALHVLEVGAQFGSARVATVTNGFECLADDSEEFGRQIESGAVAHGGIHGPIDIEQSRGAFFGEGKPTGCHFVEHDPETPDVAACVEVEAARLLRRHVAGCADHHSRLRARLHTILVGRLRHGGKLCEPEVEDFHVPVATHHDVLGLDVTMHEAAEQMLILRFMVGLGVGGMWPNGVALVAECWPNTSRPTVAGVLGAGINVGIIGLSILGSLYPITPDSWLWIFITAAIPAVLGLIVITLLPESPKWLASRGQSNVPAPPLGALFRGDLLRPTLIGILLASVPLLAAGPGANG